MEHYRRIRVILSGLPISGIKSLEEGWSAAANPTTRKEVGVDHYKLGHKYARV